MITSALFVALSTSCAVAQSFVPSLDGSFVAIHQLSVGNSADMRLGITTGFVGQSGRGAALDVRTAYIEGPPYEGHVYLGMSGSTRRPIGGTFMLGAQLSPYVSFVTDTGNGSFVKGNTLGARVDLATSMHIGLGRMLALTPTLGAFVETARPLGDDGAPDPRPVFAVVNPPAGTQFGPSVALPFVASLGQNASLVIAPGLQLPLRVGPAQLNGSHIIEVVGQPNLLILDVQARF